MERVVHLAGIIKLSGIRWSTRANRVRSQGLY
jgi:hypothetical protein